MKHNLRHNLLFTAVLASSLAFAFAPSRVPSRRGVSEAASEAKAADRPADEQEENDKYIRLMSAQSVRILEIDGRTYRKAEGPARFLHNNTWLICDTALWDVDQQIIYATGNVSIEQENTELTSDSLTYVVEENLARFRGALVQLRDKENNTLRTNHLDYNTKDSLAKFLEGGAMRDKDGQLIESTKGEYSGKRKEFIFLRDVNMFTDSVFVKTSYIIYDTPSSKASFPEYVEAWKDDKMLAGGQGWYDRSNELFFFMDKVHLMSSTQEGWSDSLYFNRKSMDVQMQGNAQVVDQQRSAVSLAGKIYYIDSLSMVRMYDDPVIVLETEDIKDSLTMEHDSVYFRADSLKYWTVRRCDVDSAAVVMAASRLNDISADPIAGIRKKAAEEAEKAKLEALKNDPNTPPEVLAEIKAKENGEAPKPATTPPPSDSLSVAGDSLAVVDSSDIVSIPDTSKIAFLNAQGKVKVFRHSMQASCDSLLYSDLDSLARMYKDPIIWNGSSHQYQADSIWIAVKNNSMDKANLMSNAFIMISEENLFYDQIKSAEMSAYFNSDGSLKRFDAMGGASALFYIKEKEKIATANKKEATVLSAEFDNGDLSQITYYESPKSDAYPVAQMKDEEKKLKGFSWRPNMRPASMSDLTSRKVRPTERQYYQERPKAEFARTQKYFKGYMDKVYREIERSDSLRRARNNAPAAEKDTSFKVVAPVPDTLSTIGPEKTDTLVAPVIAPEPVKEEEEPAVTEPWDTTAVSDTLPKIDPTSKEYIKAQKKAKAEQKRKAREEARNARWSALDQKDALKQAKKDAGKTAKKQKKLDRQAALLAKQIKVEDELREKYKQKFLKRMGYDRAVAGNLTPDEIQKAKDRLLKAILQDEK